MKLNKVRASAIASATYMTLTALCLTACGGGGAGSDAPPTGNQVSGLDVPTQPVAPVVTGPSAEEQMAAANAALRAAEEARSLAMKVYQKNQKMVGANVMRPDSYSRTHEFVDLVKLANGFADVNNPSSFTVPLGSDGWPTTDFSIMLLTAQSQTQNLEGVYTVVYSGEVASVRASVGTLGPATVDSATGKTVRTLTLVKNTDSSINQVVLDQLYLAFTLKRDGNGAVIAPVKDLQVIRPGYDWRNPPLFTAEYLKHLSKFSILRFMDWTATNTELGVGKRDPVSIWADRPTPVNKRTNGGSTSIARGVPWEYVVALANVTNSDPWINVPPKAEEPYILSLANFLKTGLTQNQKIYLEFGNEMWNDNFAQSRVLKQLAADEVAAGTVLGRKLNYDNKVLTGVTVADDETLRIWRGRLYAEKFILASKAFKTVFGDNGQVRPVLTWQAARAGSMEDIIAYVKRHHGPLADFMYALSGGFYYSVPMSLTSEELLTGSNLTESQVLAHLGAANDRLPVSLRYERNVILARKNGLKYVGYEGGPDTAGGHSLTSKAAAMRSSESLNHCRKHLTDWFSSGGDMYMWYYAGAGRWDLGSGAWPLVEQISDLASPRYLCMDWASLKGFDGVDPFVPTARHEAPVKFSAGLSSRSTGDSSNYLTDMINTEKVWYQIGTTRDYAVSSRAAACYQLKLYTQNLAGNAAVLETRLNGQVVDTAPAKAIAGAPSLTTGVVDMGSVCLPAGVSALTFTQTGPVSAGTTYLFSIELAPLGS